MGFLPPGTNNVIVDAVLTDTGRKQLAEGTFNIAKFAFCDDEVDYGIIKKFGRTVGKEKIEKLTPVLEASTIEDLAGKYRVLSFSNPDMTIIPSLTLDTVLKDGFLSLNRSSVAGATASSISCKQDSGSAVVDSEVTNYSYTVKLDNTTMFLAGHVPIGIDAYNIATYLLNANTALSPNNTSSLTFTVSARPLSNDIFNELSYTLNGTARVSRNIQIYGNNDGQSLVIEAQIF